MPGRTLEVRSRRYASATPNGDEHEQRFEETVREAERETDEQDRRPAPEEAQQRLADAAERQLLDDRRDDREEDEVRGERARMRRLPVRRGQPLLLARALRQRQRRDDRLPCVDRDDDTDRKAERATPAARPAQREQVGPVDRDHQHDPEPDRVEDHPADEGRVAVDGRRGCCRSRNRSPWRRTGRVVQRRDRRDEARPDGEARPVHARILPRLLRAGPARSEVPRRARRRRRRRSRRRGRPASADAEPCERELEDRRLGLRRTRLGRGDDGVDEPVEAERREVIVQADVPVRDDGDLQARGGERAAGVRRARERP